MNTGSSLAHRYMTRLFITILAMLFTGISLAATYYISPSGNDITGNGNIGNPWKTLAWATQTVTTSGDIIHVTPGTYLETVQCFLAPGVSIEGEGTNCIIKSTLTALYKEILSLSSPEGTNGNQHISNLKFDGQNLSTFWAIWVKGRSNVSIYNCTIVDFQERGVIFSARNDLDDSPPNSAYSTGNKFYNNIVNNCAAYNISTGIYGRGCLNIGGQEGMEIYNNVIAQNGRPEGFNGWPIKYINHGYLKNCKIYYNTLIKIPYGGNYPGERGWDFCIELFNIQGLEIYGNNIQGSIDLNYNTKGSYPYCAWIHDNVINQPVLNTKYESGIIFEFDTESAIVENNNFTNLSAGVQFNTRTGSVISNCIIAKNQFTNLGHGEGAGTSGGVLIISEGTNDPVITNLYVYQNTFTTVPGKEPFFCFDFTSQANGNATGVTIRNNIINGFLNAWISGSNPTKMSKVSLLHNQVTNCGNNNKPLWPGGDPASYTYDYKMGDPNDQNRINFRTDQ